MTDATAPDAAAAADAGSAQHEAFRRKRDQSVRAPQGALALTTTAWISEPTTVEGVPGTWAPSPTGDGLQVTADASAGIVVDGQTVDGDVAVYSQSSMTPSSVRFDDRLTAFVIGPDFNGRCALRVWDAEAAVERGFTGISAFDYDPAWHLQGTFEAVEGGVAFEYGKSQGGTLRQALSPGRIRFERDGQQVELVALPDGDSLQIVFADATTGDESYDVGRFLFVRPRHDGTVDLDFNRAIVPPCAMSDQYNCPLPPAGNRLAFPIRAGEQRPTFAA
ncbi:DUF1684 domain-containing protein [Agrococcus sp. ARC_14]|uniref:DUF1684 domain-containing protein n=1 Tax=Agrococcus sp. ARC_14 TaxID=2919927 RepID=UPI001F062379|nr:DUF1684 domain-containing protein [Agrococcus sp. ARC_14]MCH1882974.1 DUF1684 domain-containing protein [Agrococcus sp. ARC_14]